MPLYGYCEELELNYGIKVSEQTLMCWFKEIGPFKGTLRKTSTRPTGRETYWVCALLENYIDFVTGVSEKRRLFFADKKPMKEIMIFSRVRNDVLTNKIPVNIVPSSAKNCFNILCALNLKGGDIPPCDFVVLEETKNAAAVASTSEPEPAHDESSKKKARPHDHIKPIKHWQVGEQCQAIWEKDGK